MDFLGNKFIVNILVRSCVYSKVIKLNIDLTGIKLILYKIIKSYDYS